MNSTKVIILCAGTGSRLRPLTSNTPKSLIPISGQPLVSWQIKLFKRKFLPTYIVTGYFKDSVESAFSEIKFFHNKDYEKTNMLYSLFCAKDLIKSSAEKNDLIISYGDIIFNQKLLEDLYSNDSPLACAADVNFKEYWEKRMSNILSDLESFSLNDQGNIISIGQPVDAIEDISAQYMGLFKISSSFIKKFIDEWEELCRSKPKEIKNFYITDFLQHLIDLGYPITPVLNKKPWAEIDTISDIRVAEDIINFENF